VSAALDAMRATARSRAAAIALAGTLPWCLPAGALALRLGGGAWWLLPVAVLVLAGVLAARAARRIDAAWVARRLDALAPQLEDSAGLLDVDAASLPALARLQRARVEARLAAVDARALPPAWPRRAGLSAGAALAAALLVALLPHWRGVVLPVPPRATTQPSAAPTGLAQSTLQVRPPAYTGQPMQTLRGLDAEALAGSGIAWRLRPRAVVATLALQFHDGQVQPLVRDGAEWTTQLRAERTRLYRVLADGKPLAPRWHRLVVRADRPPVLRVRQPAQSLTVLEKAQAGWTLEVEASDDFGLGAASVSLTLAQGSGENIRVSTRTLALAGTGDARTRRYRRQLDLRALGFAAGDDLVLRVQVADRRNPAPQLARSPAYILRWPAPRGAEASGVEGLVTRTLPAYFRSQRQIIIDTEALIAERPRLAAERFGARADGIGVDQRILRLRYGQFLGEESEGAPRALPATPAANAAPVPDAPASPFAGVVAPSNATPQADATQADATQADATQADATQAAPPSGEHGDGDTHDGATGPRAPGAVSDGGVAAVVAAFGHTHDEAEAATLLDPETRVLLKAALDAMWLAEGELRTAHPERALPHEYRALRLVKRVQQASRIYLARVGLQLPPVDVSRRLTGKREGIAPARVALQRDREPGADAAVARLWPFVAEASTPASVDAVARNEASAQFAQWLQARSLRAGDEEAALALFEAFDAWRAAPDCAPCRAALRRGLWPLLPPAPIAAPPRSAPDASGQRYLDARAEPSR
jgi:hypothetical protein